jgi:enterochelin esterase-like enzyme
VSAQPGGAPDPFEGEQWTPLPRRPGVPPQRVRVERADDHPATRSPVPDDSGSARDGTIDVLAHDADGALIRLRHRAPAARAVAAQINGWWHPDPPDGLDLAPEEGGWFGGVIRVPADLCASITFLEHEGSGDPPWWSEGLKGSRPGGPSAAQRSRARADGTHVLDLPRGRHLVGPASATVSTHELPGPADGPRARWCLIGGTEGTSEAAVLIATDGEAHVDRLDTPGLLAEAVRAGSLPPLLAVFVDAWPERSRDLGVPGGHAAWIAEHLVPRLREEGLRPPDGGRRVRADPDPRRTIVTGASFGGLTALFALARAPQLIGGAIAQSVSLWRYPRLALAPPLRAALDAAGPGGARVRLHAGRYEGTMNADARELAEAVAGATGSRRAAEPRDTAEARIPVRLQGGGHDWAWWQPAMIEELTDLLADSAAQSSRRTP